MPDSAVVSDLRLLMDCLKCQTDNPSALTQALSTIASMCANHKEGKEFLKTTGGLTVIWDLVKSARKDDVQQVAIYALGCAVERNLPSQQEMCSPSLFGFVLSVLTDTSPSPRRLQTASFLLLCLVANNGAGQALTRKSGCLDALINLFKTLLPEISSQSPETAVSTVDVWFSVSSTLSACVNNPQNDENQRRCTEVFPMAVRLLQEVSVPEIIRPVCSLLGLVVTNNVYSQDRLRTCGGIQAIVSVFHRALNRCHQDDKYLQMALSITVMTDAMVTENKTNAIAFGRAGVVPLLMRLIESDLLEPRSVVPVVITLAHCVDKSEENQAVLRQLDVVGKFIRRLGDTEDEGLGKALKYVLQCCVQPESAESRHPEAYKMGRELKERLARIEKNLELYSEESEARFRELHQDCLETTMNSVQSESAHSDHPSAHSDHHSVHSDHPSVHSDHHSVHSDHRSVHSDHHSVHSDHRSAHSDYNSVHRGSHVGYSGHQNTPSGPQADTDRSMQLVKPAAQFALKKPNQPATVEWGPPDYHQEPARRRDPHVNHWGPPSSQRGTPVNLLEPVHNDIFHQRMPVVNVNQPPYDVKCVSQKIPSLRQDSVLGSHQDGSGVAAVSSLAARPRADSFDAESDIKHHQSDSFQQPAVEERRFWQTHHEHPLESCAAVDVMTSQADMSVDSIRPTLDTETSEAIVQIITAAEKIAKYTTHQGKVSGNRNTTLNSSLVEMVGSECGDSGWNTSRPLEGAGDVNTVSSATAGICDHCPSFKPCQSNNQIFSHPKPGEHNLARHSGTNCGHESQGQMCSNLPEPVNLYQGPQCDSEPSCQESNITTVRCDQASDCSYQPAGLGPQRPEQANHNTCDPQGHEKRELPQTPINRVLSTPEPTPATLRKISSFTKLPTQSPSASSVVSAVSRMDEDTFLRPATPPKHRRATSGGVPRSNIRRSASRESIINSSPRWSVMRGSRKERSGSAPEVTHPSPAVSMLRRAPERRFNRMKEFEPVPLPSPAISVLTACDQDLLDMASEVSVTQPILHSTPVKQHSLPVRQQPLHSTPVTQHSLPVRQQPPHPTGTQAHEDIPRPTGNQTERRADRQSQGQTLGKRRAQGGKKDKNQGRTERELRAEDEVNRTAQRHGDNPQYVEAEQLDKQYEKSKRHNQEQQYEKSEQHSQRQQYEKGKRHLQEQQYEKTTSSAEHERGQQCIKTRRQAEGPTQEYKKGTGRAKRAGKRQQIEKTQGDTDPLLVRPNPYVSLCALDGRPCPKLSGSREVSPGIDSHSTEDKENASKKPRAGLSTGPEPLSTTRLPARERTGINHRDTDTGVRDQTEDHSLSRKSCTLGASISKRARVCASKCQGCQAPSRLGTPVLTSRTYNMAIETSSNTCHSHRMIREEERKKIAERRRSGNMTSQTYDQSLTRMSGNMTSQKRSETRSLGQLSGLSREPVKHGIEVYDFPFSPEAHKNRYSKETRYHGDTIEHREEATMTTRSVSKSNCNQNTNQPRVSERTRSEVNSIRDSAVETPSGRRHRVPFSAQEERNIMEGVATMGTFWNQILMTYGFHPSRTAVDLKDKYKRMKAKYMEADNGYESVRSSASVHGPPFSMAEDRRLQRGVRTVGPNWTTILKMFSFCPGRTATQLRNRWRALTQGKNVEQ